MAGIGHNSGRSLEGGTSFRTYAWRRARKQLLPQLPLEVVRLRVRRAKELGLPYRTYAGLRASTGHDLVGFLFSTNALRVLRMGQTLPEDRAEKLRSLVKTQRVALCPPVIRLDDPVIDRVVAAPAPMASWPVAAAAIKAAARQSGAAADRFVIVGDLALERDWAEAGQAAGYLSADSFFRPLPV